MTEEITRTDNPKPAPELDPDTCAVAAAYEIARARYKHMGWKPLAEAPDWVRRRLVECDAAILHGEAPLFFSDPKHDEFFWAVVTLARGGHPGVDNCGEIIRYFVQTAHRVDECRAIAGGQFVPREGLWRKTVDWFRRVFKRRGKGVYLL